MCAVRHSRTHAARAPVALRVGVSHTTHSAAATLSRRSRTSATRSPSRPARASSTGTSNFWHHASAHQLSPLAGSASPTAAAALPGAARPRLMPRWAAHRPPSAVTGVGRCEACGQHATWLRRLAFRAPGCSPPRRGPARRRPTHTCRPTCADQPPLPLPWRCQRQLRQSRAHPVWSAARREALASGCAGEARTSTPPAARFGARAANQEKLAGRSTAAARCCGASSTKGVQSRR